MFAIMEGVQSKALKILGLTWSNIDRTRRLEYLKEFVDPEENFSKLWTTHRTWGKKPCVPFIRTYPPRHGPRTHRLTLCFPPLPVSLSFFSYASSCPLCDIPARYSLSTCTLKY